MTTFPIRSNLLAALFGTLTIMTWSASAAAQDGEIARYETELGSGTSGIVDSVAIILGIDAPGSALGDGDTQLVFNAFRWSNSDQVIAAVADANSDPNFHIVAERFTNGTDDRMWVGVQWNLGDGFTGGGGPESLRQFRDPSGKSAVDLYGFSISRIEMNVDDFFIDIPWQDPNGDGQYAFVTGRPTFIFFGRPIPEPSSSVLVLTSLFAMHRRRATA